MGVVLGLHGQAVVEHVGDGGHVDAACRHVGGHQHLDLAIAQRHQAAVAQTLAQCAVQGGGGEAGFLQVGRQTVALHLGGGKHDGLVDRGVTQPVVQQLALVLGVVGPEQHLLDVGVLFLRRGDGHLLHVGATFVHHAHGQLLDAGREGRAEHHGLLALLGQLVDFGQVVGEAQVQHAVGFVHHQELHLVQLDLQRTLQVQQATRRGHHQVGVLQLGDLHLVGHAAHHVGNAHAAAVLDQLNRIVRHLLCQLARGAQDQGAGHGGLEVAGVGGVLALVALGSGFATGGRFGHLTVVFRLGFGFFLVLLLNQGVQHGQQEGSRLAGAGLAGNHQVDESAGIFASPHRQGNGLCLHGCGLGVAQVTHGTHQLGRQAQFFKRIGLCGLCSLHRVHVGQHLVQGSVQRGICSGQQALLIQDVVHVFSRGKQTPMPSGSAAFLTVRETSTVKQSTSTLVDVVGSRIGIAGGPCGAAMASGCR